MVEITKSGLEQKVCDACGEKFGCGAKLDGCWCSDVKLATAIADDLQTKYQDCLCPKCLKNSDSAPSQKL
ncbi:MAG: cysteine-rich CWC family protein [Pyrinomonadaceae bacterium]